MGAIDVEPGAIPAGNWGHKADTAEELLNEIKALQPNRAEFTGGTNAQGLTYSEAMSEWMASMGEAANTAAMLRDLEGGLVTLADGTIAPRGTVPPELLAQVDAANENRYRQLLNQYNLDSYKTQNDVAQAQFNNQITTFNAKRGLDQDAQSKAEARVNRQLGGLAESRARADAVTQSLLDAAPYASPSGKSDFSGVDIGAPAASWMSRLGLNPNESLLRFTGTQTIDPEGLMAKYDQGFGVNGELTGIPDSLLGMGDVPVEPQFGAYPGMMGPTRPDLSSLLDQVSSTQTQGAPPKSFEQILAEIRKANPIKANAQGFPLWLGQRLIDTGEGNPQGSTSLLDHARNAGTSIADAFFPGSSLLGKTASWLR